ncbi:putative rRNA methylase [Gottschalkia acidurici 9a]|uniref:rRNA methylase n=1 Tax=Gottschalkia acidurici (strain ATCC 7906 / DSM 604 / BCRC 14475 / CIP 104303 / KCTC 5404 / NCIMB 10678 / 9a) TaxID=1128398 RepID=K0B0L0_GOTA9|nr:class I SAM-dependent methyltransferase [Gottschalkia acidurici]AFS78440.1 putative rRNA methylase [Gottschalkia acidurici 9a]
MYKHLNSIISIAKEIIDRTVKKGSIVVDATVGNGQDTIKLAELVGETGKVYGFDIQSIAIKNTKKRLIQENLENRVELINDGHEKIDCYISKEVDFIIFNLGYLPGGDHTIVTRKDSTLEAIKKSLVILKPNGIMLLAVYHGHYEGKVEKRYIDELLKELSQKKFNTLKFEFINQINNPPILYAIEKNMSFLKEMR